MKNYEILLNRHFKINQVKARIGDFYRIDTWSQKLNNVFTSNFTAYLLLAFYQLFYLNIRRKRY